MVLYICRSVVGCSCIDHFCRPEITLYCTSIAMLTIFNCKVFLACCLQVVMTLFLIKRLNVVVFCFFFANHTV